MKAYHSHILRNLLNLKEFFSIGSQNLFTLNRPAILKESDTVAIKSDREARRKTLIWLDDRIDPLEKKMDWLAFSPIGRDVNIVWLKEITEFQTWIHTNGLPDAICFDYDLSNSFNGFDCAEVLIDYCYNHQLLPPQWSSHSTNPEGKARINRLLKNYLILANRMNFKSFTD